MTEVGFTVGFSSSNEFSKVFRKASGFTPRAYHRPWRRFEDSDEPHGELREIEIGWRALNNPLGVRDYADAEGVVCHGEGQTSTRGCGGRHPT